MRHPRKGCRKLFRSESFGFAIAYSYLCGIDRPYVMKNRAAIILSLLTIFSLHAFAQVQKGVVRTIERPGRGVKYVDGATIRAQGLFNAAVSDAGGAFALDFGSTDIREGEAFRLSRVNKSGYELSDKGVIGKEYPLSVSVPLEIVLINIAEREADKQRIADKAYARAEQTYKTKLADLERQLSDKSIDAETYRTQLRDLQDKFDKYEKLIDAMAERYASTDYAHIDSLNARVNIAIENGELELADSLIRSVGSLEALVSQNMEAMRRADAQEEIGRAIVANAKQDKDSIAADRQRLGDLLYSKAQIHLAAFENDSTAHYYRLRAELDSTNVEWQYDAGVFLSDYLADNNSAMGYYRLALKHALEQYGKNSEQVALCYNIIGKTYSTQGEYDNALEYYKQALESMPIIFEEAHPTVATIYNNIGNAYTQLGLYKQALENLVKSLYIRFAIFGEEDFAIALSYNNIGVVCELLGDYDMALNSQKEALRIKLNCLGQKHPSIAISYNNIGTVYSHKKDYDMALEYVTKSLKLDQELFGELHPEVAASYHNIGSIYDDLKNYNQAIECYKKSLEINTFILGENHPDIATTNNNIGCAYINMRNYDTALEYLTTSLKISRNIFEEQHPDVARDFNNIGTVYYYKGNYEKALEYCEKALEINLSIFDGEHPRILGGRKTIEKIKQKIREADGK